MQNAGAVLLPAAGARHTGAINAVRAQGYYWSSSTYVPTSSASWEQNCSYSIYFTDLKVNTTTANEKDYGYSVRLVMDVK